MAEKWKERIRHAVLALLLSVGLSMALAGSLDETLISPRMLYVIAAAVVVFELASLHRISAWAGVFAAAAGLIFWIFAGNGAQILSDAGIAVSLRMKGIHTAVPLAAEQLSILIAAGMTVLCCFSALRKATCIPACMLCTAVLMVVWLTDSMELLAWLLPALAAVLTLLLSYRHEDTPVFRVLPWAAGLVALAFLLSGITPRENPIRDKADEIRQSVLDRLFFTEARDVFSLYSVGFSPQGADQLGGKPNPSDTPVMQVSTPRTVYLRGTVYNRYNGHGWQNTTGGRRYLWQSRRTISIRSELFDETLPPASVQNSLSETATVSVRMLTDSASTLFVPQRVRELNPGGETVPYFSNSSEIFITRNLQAGDTWEVSAPLYASLDPGIGTLTEICATLGDSRWESIRNIYTELPAHLEQPVRDIAAEVTAFAETPYEKAIALQNYLRRNFRYTLDVGEHPENIDFVTSFLLETKEGYCTYFASAMTVLCRMAGLPARYVEGYLAEPNENGEALVTGMNAHAWTEVYFSGFGWLTFDATPGGHSSGSGNNSGKQSTPPPAPTPEPTENRTPEPSENPTSSPKEPEPSETPHDHGATPEPEENPSEQPSDEPEQPEEPEKSPDQNRSIASSFPWWLLLAAALLILCGLRLLMISPAFLEKRAKTEERKFDLWTDEVISLLRAEKLERRNGETVMAFAHRVDKTALFTESVTPAAECLCLIRYSRSHPLESDTGLMRDTAMLLRGEISKGARLRYLIRRFFAIGKRTAKKQQKR